MPTRWTEFVKKYRAKHGIKSYISAVKQAKASGQYKPLKTCAKYQKRNPKGRCVNKVCPSGKVLNKKTGRCIMVKTVAPKRKLKPCGAGRARNPKTNRCRKVVKGCGKGRERNPKTGRCRKVCQKGYLRNPKTGRCVKVVKKTKAKK